MQTYRVFIVWVEESFQKKKKKKNDNLAIYGRLFASDYDTDYDTNLKSYFILKDAIYCFIFRTNLVDNGKNSLYWETRDRNTSAGRYR